MATSKNIHPLQAVSQRHRDFILLLILFVTFRALTLAAYRPGGLVLDYSDFHFYREFVRNINNKAGRNKFMHLIKKYFRNFMIKKRDI